MLLLQDRTKIFLHLVHHFLGYADPLGRNILHDPRIQPATSIRQMPDAIEDEAGSSS